MIRASNAVEIAPLRQIKTDEQGTSVSAPGMQQPRQEPGCSGHLDNLFRHHYFVTVSKKQIKRVRVQGGQRSGDGGALVRAAVRREASMPQAGFYNIFLHNDYNFIFSSQRDSPTILLFVTTWRLYLSYFCIPKY